MNGHTIAVVRMLAVALLSFMAYQVWMNANRLSAIEEDVRTMQRYDLDFAQKLESACGKR